MDKQTFKQHINMLLNKRANDDLYNSTSAEVTDILRKAIGDPANIGQYGQVGMNIRKAQEQASDLKPKKIKSAIKSLESARTQARDLRDTIDAHKSFTGALTEAAPSYLVSTAAGAGTGWAVADEGNKGTGAVIGAATATLLNLLRRKIKYGSGVWA